MFNAYRDECISVSLTLQWLLDARAHKCAWGKYGTHATPSKAYISPLKPERKSNLFAGIHITVCRLSCHIVDESQQRTRPSPPSASNDLPCPRGGPIVCVKAEHQKWVPQVAKSGSKDCMKCCGVDTHCRYEGTVVMACVEWVHSVLTCGFSKSVAHPRDCW